MRITAERRVYALGCWLAIEQLTARLMRGDTHLRTLEAANATAGVAYQRAALHWLRLGYRTVGLTARLCAADPATADAFVASPTCTTFDGVAWPAVPDGVDLALLELKPASETLERIGVRCRS